MSRILSLTCYFILLFIPFTGILPAAMGMGTDANSGVNTSTNTSANTGSGSLSRESLTLADEPAILARYQAKLDNLMATCKNLDMALEANVTQSSLRPVGSYGIYILNLNAPAVPEALPADATDLQKKWFAALRRLQKSTAEVLLTLAQQAAEQQKGFDAMRLLLQALNIDPNCQKARTILGYQLIDGLWRSRWEQGQLEKGLVDHPAFGWIPKDQIEKYENGFRPSRGTWIIPNDNQPLAPLRIETEHYTILCDAPIEKGVVFARLLENYFQAWQQLFYPFIASEKYWANFLSGTQKLPTTKMKVSIFENRNKYLESLADDDPNLKNSYGGYFPAKGSIYVYFPGPEEETDLNTMLIHEATHQLFQEYRYGPGQSRHLKRTMAGQKANFWMVEGIATYAETFRESGRYFELGGADTWRFQRAKERVSEPGGYLPLSQYTRLSLREFQTHDNIPMLYTQSTGLTVFFLHAENGKYRNGFLDCLRLLYDSDDTPESLAETLKTDLTTLDEEYKRFMLAAPLHTWP